MTNVVVEPKSTPSTVPYEASYLTQDNLAADWSGDTRLYLDALPSAFEQAIDYFEANRSEIEKAFFTGHICKWWKELSKSNDDKLYGLGSFLGARAALRATGASESLISEIDFLVDVHLEKGNAPQ